MSNSLIEKSVNKEVKKILKLTQQGKHGKVDDYVYKLEKTRSEVWLSEFDKQMSAIADVMEVLQQEGM